MSYAIHIQYHHYAGALNVPSSGPLQTPAYDIIAVATLDEAERLADMLNSDPRDGYALDHNEYAPPEYTAQESTAEPGSMAWAMRSLGLAPESA